MGDVCLYAIRTMTQSMITDLTFQINTYLLMTWQNAVQIFQQWQGQTRSLTVNEVPH